MKEILHIEDLWIEGRPPGGEYEPIVKGICLSVSRGEVLALIGESGSGKSTISLAMLGYARPGCRIAGGKVLLQGVEVLKLNSKERRRLRGAKVAYIAQSAAAAFNPALKINRQVTEAVRIHKTFPLNDAVKRSVELYKRLELPDPETIGFRYPHQVSGGQLQRLLAAMALCCGPELIIFDEPTTALDVTTQIEVLKAFKEIVHHRNTAAIYVTHDLSVVAQMADRIIVLHDGEIVEAGTTDWIINSPSHEYTQILMNAVRKPPKSDALENEFALNGETVDEIYLLEAQNITAFYGKRTGAPVLKDVNVTVKPKETVGVIGESGCGKSTLARVISGLLPPVSGNILLKGQILQGNVRKRRKEDLQRVQIVFQMADVALNPRQTVGEILGRPLQFYHDMNMKARRERVGELLELVELPRQFVSRYQGELSGGQKQRVNLARALAADPDVILCDEVTSALDTVVAANVIELLRGLQERLGISYLFISHDLSTVAAFADRIVVLYAGRVAEQGPTASILRPPYHPYTKLLLTSVPEMRQGWLEEVMQTRAAISGIARGVEILEIGCPFYNRCPMAIEDVCNTQTPPVRQPFRNHEILCHRQIDELMQAEQYDQIEESSTE